MTVTVRLDEETRKLLHRLAQARRLSRSEVVRRSIRLFADHEPATRESNPYDAIHDLIGRVKGGPPDLSERTGERFREQLSERRDRKR